MNDTYNKEEIILETLGSIQDIGELYIPEQDQILMDALKSKRNLIQKAKNFTLKKLEYRQKSLEKNKQNFIKNYDQILKTFQSYNSFEIKNTYENKKITENSQGVLNTENLAYSNKIKKEIKHKEKMNNILTEFNEIDNKIKFGNIDIIPKTSLLYVNENKFLSFKQLNEELVKKENLINRKIKNFSLENMKNLTPFQHVEITKTILKEKLKFKKNINSNKNNLLKEIIENKEKEKKKIIKNITSNINIDPYDTANNSNYNDFISKQFNLMNINADINSDRKTQNNTVNSFDKTKFLKFTANSTENILISSRLPQIFNTGLNNHNNLVKYNQYSYVNKKNDYINSDDKYGLKIKENILLHDNSISVDSKYSNDAEKNNDNSIKYSNNFILNNIILNNHIIENEKFKNEVKKAGLSKKNKNKENKKENLIPDFNTDTPYPRISNNDIEINFNPRTDEGKYNKFQDNNNSINENSELELKIVDTNPNAVKPRYKSIIVYVKS